MVTMGRPSKYGEPLQKRVFNFPESLSRELNRLARERGEDVTKVLHDAVKGELADGKSRETAVPVTLALADSMAEELRQIRADLKEMKIARIVARPGPIKMVPEIMAVPCGEPEEIWKLVNEVGEGSLVPLQGRLAEIATEHSFIVRAEGNSMLNGDRPDNIKDGDRLLLTPVDEFEDYLTAGMIVLAKVYYKNKRVCCTLKTYTGKRLKANNPNFSGIDFGAGIEKVTVVAICRGVVERVFA